MIFDDQILIKRIQNGDKESLGQLIEKYYGDVFSLCFYKTKDRHLAEDLTQETFIRLIDHIYSFKPKGKFRNYLYTITLNVCRDEFKKQIRAMEREDAKTIPIIAMTANVFDEDVERSLQSGMNAHLSKPIDPDVLYQTLADFINKTSRSDT